MLQSTPMLSRQDSADPRACQWDSTSPVWTRTGLVETSPIIAAVARAYNDVHPASDVTQAAILGRNRTPHVAHARHLCAYLLVADYHLTNKAAARALGRTDHTTIVNSRARVVAALADDTALQQTLAGARAILGGRAPRTRPRHAADRRHAFATATPHELAAYRYRRLCALRSRAPEDAR